MRPERLYLQDMLDAADAISRYITGVEEDEFLADYVLRDAVRARLTDIGEAASRIPKEVMTRHPQVSWRKAADPRNVLVHQYFGIIWEPIWRVATEDVPILREQIAAIIEAEFPGDPAQYLE